MLPNTKIMTLSINLLLIALLTACSSGSSSPSNQQQSTFNNTPSLNALNGSLGAVCSGLPTWSNNFNYNNSNTLVIYNNSEYANTQNTQNEQPDISPKSWREIGDCTGSADTDTENIDQAVVTSQCLAVQVSFIPSGAWYENFSISVANNCSSAQSLANVTIDLASKTNNGISVALGTIYNWYVNSATYSINFTAGSDLSQLTGTFISSDSFTPPYISANQTIIYTGGFNIPGELYNSTVATSSLAINNNSPAPGPTPVPTPTPTVTPTPGPTASPSPSIAPIPVYPSGMPYSAGSLAQAAGKVYRCIWANWCDGPAWAYAPGAASSAGNQAWSIVNLAPTPGPTPTPAPTPTPSPTPTPTATPAPGPITAGSYIFSPYKDVSINYNWASDVLSLINNGTLTSYTAVAKAYSMTAITLAFATGECGSENWGGISSSTMKNVTTQLNSAGIKYIISTGGANGAFTCSTDSGMLAFLNNYITNNTLGIDFDIEGAGLNAAQLSNLVKELKYAQSLYPNLRLSFTLATLADQSGDSVNSMGAGVVNAVIASGLKNVTYNLMAMDYGTGPNVCIMSGLVCGMNSSAQQAATNFSWTFNIPYSQIELTPMIGVNDVQANIFTLSDAKNLAAWTKSNNLAGLHYWSLDRDQSCINAWASATCSSSVAGVAVETNQYDYFNAMK